MKTKYRIKTERVADEEKFWNTLNQQDITYINEYHVQVRRFCLWWTIKKFSDADEWWAEANAKNLLDELNKTL